MVEIITTSVNDTVRPAELGGSSSMLPDSTGGDDRIIGSAGNDYIDGGGGYDILSFSGLGEPVRLNLRDGEARKGETWIDKIALVGVGRSTVEQVHGTQFGDIIVGDDNDNWVWGVAGSDTIDGGAGFDVVDFRAGPESSGSGIQVNLGDFAVPISRVFRLLPGEAMEQFRLRAMLTNVEGIAGTEARDQVFGGRGPDLFWGLQGDDNFFGRSGLDTAVYLHQQALYHVTLDLDFGQRYVINGPDGQDSVASVERLRFSDGDAWIEDAAGVTDVVHRFYNTYNGTHFFTASNEEANFIREHLPAFDHEGFAFRAAGTGTPSRDIFHFYNAQISSHFYTASEAERDYIRGALPQYDLIGVSFQAHTVNDGSKVELHRFYDAQKQSHFFTASEAERDSILAGSASFRYEGVAFYVDPI
jgi:hypothetical protein